MRKKPQNLPPSKPDKFTFNLKRFGVSLAEFVYLKKEILRTHRHRVCKTAEITEFSFKEKEETDAVKFQNIQA